MHRRTQTQKYTKPVRLRPSRSWRLWAKKVYKIHQMLWSLWVIIKELISPRVSKYCLQFSSESIFTKHCETELAYTIIIVSTIMPCYDLHLYLIIINLACHSYNVGVVLQVNFYIFFYWQICNPINTLANGSAGWQQSISELFSQTSSNSLLNLFSSLWRHFWQSRLFFAQQTLSHMFPNFSLLAVIICNILVFTHSNPICSTLRQAISHYLTHHPHCQCWRVGDLWNCISNPRA